MINKVSEITADDVANYLRITLEISDALERKYLNTILNISKKYISNYTGCPIEKLDNYSDYVYVVFVLCQDMYDNRTMYVDNNNINKLVDSVLSMHSINLL